MYFSVTGLHVNQTNINCNSNVAEVWEYQPQSDKGSNIYDRWITSRTLSPSPDDTPARKSTFLPVVNSLPFHQIDC